MVRPFHMASLENHKPSKGTTRRWTKCSLPSRSWVCPLQAPDRPVDGPRGSPRSTEWYLFQESLFLYEDSLSCRRQGGQNYGIYLRKHGRFAVADTKTTEITRTIKNVTFRNQDTGYVILKLDKKTTLRGVYFDHSAATRRDTASLRLVALASAIDATLRPASCCPNFAQNIGKHR